MQDVQTKAIQTYTDNMSYLNEKHSSIHTKILALNSLLEDGKYPQKYDLEYINGYFDVIELATGNFLYNENSVQHAQNICDGVNLIKNDHTIESFLSLDYNMPELNITDIKNINPCQPHLSIAPIIHYYNQNINKNYSLEKIYKYMFFGTGLGLHIEKIVQKIDADVYFIVEDDIELFRLSLFTCNYKKLFDKKFVFFSIAQNDVEFSASFHNFYMRAVIENHFLKFSVFSSKDAKYIKKVQTEIVIRPEKCYGHHALLLKNIRVMQNVTKGYKFLSMLSKEHDFFKDKPLLILGAGPSLEKNKQWLKENHKKFIIIAPFVTLKLLYKIDISPDIVVHIDEGDPVANREVLYHKRHMEYFKNTLFIFAASVSKIFFDTFEKEKIYLLEERTSYKKNNNQIQIASVGETVYAIGLSLSQNNIYLLGLDLSITDDGQTHMSEHNSGTKNTGIDTKTAEIVEENASLRKTTLLVKGNFKDKVPTIPLFELSIRAMDFQSTRYSNNNRKVYNLSDGAYFKNTFPLNIDEVILKELSHERKKIFKLLKEILDHYSSETLIDKEKQAINLRKNQVELYYKILDDFLHAISSNDKTFIQSYIKLVTSFLQMDHDELHQIIFIYILEVGTYPIDMISTIELKNKKKHIKKIKKMLYTLIKNIIDIYDKNLEELIKQIESNLPS